MPALAYAAAFLLFLPAFAAMVWGGHYAWHLPFFAFVIIPILDQVLPRDLHNREDADEAAALASPVFSAQLAGIVVLQVALLVAYLVRMTTAPPSGWELAGTVFTMGLACGVYGINVGHELGHRREAWAQALAKVALATSLYGHFFVEHNRGHHRRVATPDDPASSREGESVYAFWLRSVTGSWRSAWSLENERMGREGLPWWSWHNEMVRLTAGQAAAVAVVFAVFGPVGVASWVAAALGGALLLETVNYLEHYGLARQRNERGVFERVQPHHSWNSDRVAGRVFLFDLPRHSDHHAHATRPYQVLRHLDGTPELPAGYPAMILAALVPPLFHAVMGRALADWRGQYGGRVEAA